MAKQTAANRSKPTSSATGLEANGETPSGYFRRILNENRKLLKGRNDEELLNRWLADHPGFEVVPKNVRQILSNVKSVMRSKRRRRKAAKTQQGGQEMPTAARSAIKVKGNKLEALEEQIDDVLAVAKSLDREGLDDVIKLLRRARNEVVWKMGQ